MYKTLEDARTFGMRLGCYGQYPTIYKRGVNEYILVEKGEWPPTNSWPFLKWDGNDWVPVLAKLDTLEHAQEASCLFALLGHEPIIVEFPGISFDLFFREAHIPTGAWIISEINANYSIKYLKPPDIDSEEEESEIIEIEMESV